MTETVTRVRVTPLSPEEGGQLVALMGLAGPQPKVGQERLSLLGRQVYGVASREASLEATKKRQPKGDHHGIANTWVGLL
jgi:hypothetical protein